MKLFSSPQRLPGTAEWLRSMAIALVAVALMLAAAMPARADIQRRAVLQWADGNKWSDPIPRQVTFFKGAEIKKINPKLAELPDDKVYAFADLGQQKVLLQLDADKVKSPADRGFTAEDFRAIFEEKSFLMGPDVLSLDKRTWLITARKGKDWVDQFENRNNK